MPQNLTFSKNDNRWSAIYNDVQITFSNVEKDFLLDQISYQKRREFLRIPSHLWKIVLTNKRGEHQEISSEGKIPELSQSENGIIFIWKSLPVNDQSGSVSVKVNLAFSNNSRIQWNISVTELPENWSVFRVYFPAFNLLTEKSDDYKLIVPVDRGVEYKNPLETIPTGGIIESKKIRERPYPHGGYTMQFMGFIAQDDLFYFAAEDPDAHLKVFYFKPDKESKTIQLFPYWDTEIHYGKNYDSFNWVTVLQKGDWFDAAQLYRKFALKAQWTKKGPIEKGKKTPLWYQKTPIVSLRLNRGAGYEDEDLIKEAEFYGVPMLCHYYMWHKNAFDAKNPYFFPTVPGFRNTIQKLRNYNLHVMPYVNPYSADTSLPEWQDNLENSAMKITEDGQLSLLTWSQGKTFAGMCPQAPMWRRIINQLSMRMYEMGIKALYFDEVAASSPRTCYDHRHGHILGGGNGYVKSYWSYFDEVKEEASEFLDEPVITMEGCAEAYINQVDAFLIGNMNDPQEIPLFEAVYHDYVMGFGRYTFTPELTDKRFKGAIISKHAQQFIWGRQFGWSRIPHIAIIQKDPETAEFLKHLAHTWVNNYDFLVWGKMLRPLDLSDQLKPVKRLWARAWNDNKGTELYLSPVLNSVWQKDDGSIAVVLVNITDQTQKCYIKLPNQQEMLAEMMSKEGSVSKEVKESTNYYPLPQCALGILREQQGDTAKSMICSGDSENGFEVELSPLKCNIIIIGSEKDYGVHN